MSEAAGRGLWVEEPARRRRMPDPVRASAVRAVLVVAVTLTEASATFFLVLTGSWLALPMVLGAIAGTVVATWAVLDVWITRQMWNQRYG
ncbi:membrane protein, partial [Streptomyces sp. RSD-27]